MSIPAPISVAAKGLKPPRTKRKAAPRKKDAGSVEASSDDQPLKKLMKPRLEGQSRVGQVSGEGKRSRGDLQRTQTTGDSLQTLREERIAEVQVRFAVVAWWHVGCGRRGRQRRDEFGRFK